MARQPLQSLFTRFWVLSRRHKLSGFTLIELLMSSFIGAIAVSGLLALVVQLLQTDQRESVRSETQREMQMALDYISEDLQEAAYVYAGDCLQGRQDDTSTPVDEYCPGVVNHIPSIANTVGVPVLAFWKSEPLPDGCRTTRGQANDPCFDFRLSSRTYSLVVYFLNKQTPPWQGKARITRYVLDQLSTKNNIFGLTTGYINPTNSSTSFRTWPQSRQPNGTWQNLQTQRPAFPPGDPDTLVDFVDTRGSTPDPEPCDPANPEYVPSPSSTTLGTGFAGIRSFYACVRVVNPAAPGEQQSGLNQDAIVYLRGSTYGKQGSQDSVLTSLQTQVLGRGVVDKQPPPPQ